MQNAKKETENNVFQQNTKSEPSEGQNAFLFYWLLGAKIFNFDWLGVGVNIS